MVIRGSKRLRFSFGYSFLLCMVVWQSCAQDSKDAVDTDTAPPTVRQQISGADFQAKPADIERDVPVYAYYLSIEDAIDNVLTRQVSELIREALSGRKAYVAPNHQLYIVNEDVEVSPDQLHPDFRLILLLHPRADKWRTRHAEKIELKITGTSGSPAYSTGVSTKIATPIGTERRVVTNRLDICQFVSEHPCDGEARRVSQNLFRVLLGSPFQ